MINPKYSYMGIKGYKRAPADEQPFDDAYGPRKYSCVRNKDGVAPPWQLGFVNGEVGELRNKGEKGDEG